MVSKTRTSINIPSDLLSVISKIRQKTPDISQQEALILLARKGAMNFEFTNLLEISDSIQRLEIMMKNLSEKANEDKFSDDCTIKTFAILRRYIHSSDPELLKLCDTTSEQLLSKIKE